MASDPVAEALASDFGRAALMLSTATDRASRYFSNPVLFSHECIRWPDGYSLADYQEEIMMLLVNEMRVASRGPRGYGKSAAFALLIIWFAITRELAGIPWKIVTTAGAWAQLEDYLWPEVHTWVSRIRWDVLGMDPWRNDRELLKLGIQLPHGSAIAANPKVSARIEGGHAAQFLYVFDEAKLIPSTTWDSAEGSAASATGGRELRWLAQSSGGDADGRFFEICSGRVRGWVPKHVTKDEAIAAGRVSAAWADQMLELWGSESPAYQNHVLGNFATTGGTNTVIRLADVERAIERGRSWLRAGAVLPDVLPIFGVDVGTGNLDRDPATVAPLYGDIFTQIAVHRFTDKYPDMQLVGIVNGLLEAGGIAVVDALGQGSGVVSRLRELDRPVLPFVAGAGSSERDRSGAFGFKNLRAQAWWRFREALADPESTLALPDDPILTGELIAPTWRAHSGAKIQVESKDDIAARLGKLESRKRLNEGGSTNRADAVIQAHYGRTANAELVIEEIRTIPSETEEIPRFEW